MEQAFASTGRIFRAAWQRSLEDALRSELLEVAKKHTATMYAEMNKRALEVVANIQARLILSENSPTQDFNGLVTLQLLLCPGTPAASRRGAGGSGGAGDNAKFYVSRP